MARDDLDRVSRRGDRVLAETFNEFRRTLRRERVAIAGVPSFQTAGGFVTMSAAAKGKVVMIKTDTSLYARSGTTPGTGTGKLVSFNGTDLAEGDEVDLKNLSGTAGATGKYGFAILLEGAYWVISLEC